MTFCLWRAFETNRAFELINTTKYLLIVSVVAVGISMLLLFWKDQQIITFFALSVSLKLTINEGLNCSINESRIKVRSFQNTDWIASC